MGWVGDDESNSNMLCLRSQVDMPCRQLDPGIFQFSKEGLGLEL